MTLEEIKKFAGDQFCTGAARISVFSEKHGIEVCNPWIDPTGRLALTDEEAVNTYGKELIEEFQTKVSATKD